MSGDNPKERLQGNRLRFERSPYLLKHASNPVDWYPWCDEAFEKALSEDKPIFLSIGYFSCHWCTVMEKESFEDPEVAKLMNETFVNIKVDREERPDIDDLYMRVCQLMTGSGGWPLTIIMTPDKKPFFAATYIPRETRSGMVGMLDLIPRVQQLWKDRRGELIHEGEEMLSILKKLAKTEKGDSLSEEDVEAAYEQLISSFDEEFGGFGVAPKFPSADKLMFLLRYWKVHRSKAALIMVEKTLTKMRAGGIFDQVGYGFHRYSTDQMWMVPHFEKMLYDQAMLATTYTEAYLATGKSIFGRTAQQVLDYAMECLLSREGGFYSSEDADSEGEEGKFYVWSDEQFKAALGDKLWEDGRRLLLDGAGVLHTGSETLKVLHLSKIPDDSESEQPSWQMYEEVRRLLYAARATRPRPARDEKILTDWNGLMLAALSKAAWAFGEEGKKYLLQAKRTADFLMGRVIKTKEVGGVREFNGLYHGFKDGEPFVDGFLDDYAFLAWGLLELYQVTFDVKYLKTSLEVARFAYRFWDPDGGGFCRGAKNDVQYGLKDAQDGSVPSGNAVMVLVLTLLSRITGDTSFEEKVKDIEKAFSKQLRSYPSAYTFLLLSTVLLRRGFHEIVIVGKAGSKDVEELLATVRSKFLPNKVVLLRDVSFSTPPVDSISSYTSSYNELSGNATVYVCSNFACSQPTNSTETLSKMLED